MSTEVEEKQKQSEVARTILSSFGAKPVEPPAKVDPAPEAKPEDKPVEQASDAKVTEVEKAEEKPAPQDTTEAKPKRAKAPRIIKAEELLDEDAITKAATAAATAAVRASQVKEDPKPEPEPELPRSVQRKMALFHELEQDTKFKGIVKQVVDFKKVGGIEDQYKAQWLKENPGESFDPNDDQHTDWYADNDPTNKFEDIDEQLEDAQVRVIKREAREEAAKALAEENSRRQTEERRQRVAPMAEQTANDSVMEALEAIDPKLVEVVRKDGEKGLADEDPIALKLVSQAAQIFSPLITETIKISEGLVSPTQSNPVHAKIEEVMVSIENAVLALDPSDRIKVETVGGRQVQKRFATMEDFANMPTEKRSRYWTVGKDEVVHKLRADQKTIIKQEYDQLTSAMKKRYGQNSAQPAAGQQAQQSRQQAATVAQKHVSPSVGGSTPAPAPKADDGSKKPNPSDLFLSRFRSM